MSLAHARYNRECSEINPGYSGRVVWCNWGWLLAGQQIQSIGGMWLWVNINQPKKVYFAECTAEYSEATTRAAEKEADIN